MFNNIKNRFVSAIAPDLPSLPSNKRERDHKRGAHLRHGLLEKFPYGRPPFLQLLTNDELRASADHNVRPIIVPRDINMLPWTSGYAECVNSGKSEWNEDQAAFCRQVLSDPEHKHPDLPYTYFGIYDGHAGCGAALAASHQFHHILHEKLVDCIEQLLPRGEESANEKLQFLANFPHPTYFQRRVSRDELVVGALESAFFHMDSLIAQDRNRFLYRDPGGCTACVTLFIDGKMYVANAGDSRAVLCQRRAEAVVTQSTTLNRNRNESHPVGAAYSYPTPYSADHTPETERDRLLNVARLKPQLMGKQYVAMEYAKRPHIKNLGQRILCRHGTMKGWIYKTLTREDLLMPVVNGEGKRSRLLGTLGVTRGFGDHDLLAINTGIEIKPFLTPQPDVRQRDLSQVVSIIDEYNEDGDYGILVMATDGLWDVSGNEAVARTVFQTLSQYPKEKHRYTMVAQELVARARGKINDSGHWRLADSKAAATVDDISVIVIPVYQYYKEYIEWTHNYKLEIEQRQRKAAEANVAQGAVNELNGITGEEAHVVKERLQEQKQQQQMVFQPLQKDREQSSQMAQRREGNINVELNNKTQLQSTIEAVNETFNDVHLDVSVAQATSKKNSSVNKKTATTQQLQGQGQQTINQDTGKE